jgi:hypothetical protein
MFIGKKLVVLHGFMQRKISSPKPNSFSILEARDRRLWHFILIAAILLMPLVYTTIKSGMRTGKIIFAVKPYLPVASYAKANVINLENTGAIA